MDGKIIGYTRNKVELQKKINSYINSGDGNEVAFVEIDTLPVYQPCLLKRGTELNDDKILDAVIESGTAYYKYYAISQDNEEKVYLKTFTEAEETIAKLKEKESTNADKLGIVEKYAKKQVVDLKVAGEIEKATEVENEGSENAKKIDDIKLATVDESVSKLFVEKPKVTSRSSTKSTTKKSAYTAITKTVTTQPQVKTNLGISLVKPVVSNYTISSGFGIRSRDNHKGIDVAAPKGTAIFAAASGKVLFSGAGSPYGGYGYIVVIQSTENPSLTFRYAHCSKLYVKTGQIVDQNQLIAAVGSTGISTGNHLHFEIRINGVAVDPQRYLY